jgi:hypothetical protein
MARCGTASATVGRCVHAIGIDGGRLECPVLSVRHRTQRDVRRNRSSTARIVSCRATRLREADRRQPGDLALRDPTYGPGPGRSSSIHPPRVMRSGAVIRHRTPRPARSVWAFKQWNPIGGNGGSTPERRVLSRRQSRLRRAGVLRRGRPARGRDDPDRRFRARGIPAAQLRAGGAVHAVPIGADDRTPLDSIGQPHGRGHGRGRPGIGRVGTHTWRHLLRRRLRHVLSGQVAHRRRAWTLAD